MLRTIALLVSILGLAGCATTEHAHYSETRPASIPATEHSASDVTLYNWEDTLPPSYEILGTIYVYKHGTSRFQNPSWRDIDATVLEYAHNLDADAIIGVKTGKRDHRISTGFVKWKSGVAAKIIPEAQGNRPTPANSVVAILPLQFREENSDKVTERIHELAHFEFGEKGYYTYEASAVDPDASFQEMETWEQERLDNYGGRWADLLLQIEVVDAGSGLYVGIAAKKTSRFAAQIFSKSQRKIIWSNEAEASKGAFGWGEAILAGGQAFRKAFSQLFDTLPSVYKE